MELSHIPIEKLHIATVNMRHGKHAPDISDILPSVRARGILQPLLVRPNADGYEIVAGRRRYFSAKAVADEQGAIAPLPCAIMEPGDDAAALEASLIENVARRDADGRRIRARGGGPQRQSVSQLRASRPLSGTLGADPGRYA